MGKELEELEEGLKAKMHIDSLRTTLKKKYQIGKSRSWILVQKIHFHLWETSYQNK